MHTGRRFVKLGQKNTQTCYTSNNLTTPFIEEAIQLNVNIDLQVHLT